MSSNTFDLIKEILGLKKVGGSSASGKHPFSKSIVKNAPFSDICQFMKMKDGLHRAFLRVAPINQSNLNLDELNNIVSHLQELFNAEPGAVQLKASSEPLHIESYLEHVTDLQNNASTAYWFDRIEKYHAFGQSKKAQCKSQKQYYLTIRSELMSSDEAQKDLVSKIEIAQEKFEQADMIAQEMTDDEIRKVFYRKMNPRASLTQDYDETFTNSELFPSYAHDGETYLEVDETYFRQYFVTKYPLGKDKPGWFNALLDEGNVDIDIFCVPADLERLSTSISNSIQNLQDKHDEARSAKLKNELIRKLNSQERMLNEIYDNKGYEVTVVITIHEDSLEKLEKRARKIELSIKSSQLRGKLLVRRHFNPFYYYLPLCYTDELIQKYSIPMHSRTIASMLPYNASEITSRRGAIVGTNPDNGSLIIIDRYDREKYNNGNGVTFGASGSGKSFLTDTEIDRNIVLNAVDRTVLIDPEREHHFPYGKRVVFEIGGKDCTNPFHLRSIVLDNESDSKDGILHAGWKMLSQTSDIISWLKWIYPSLSAEEASKLSRIVRRCYGYHGILENTESLPNGYEGPTLLTLEKFAKEEGHDNFVDILDPYTHGEYRSLFCGQTNWNMNDKLNILDIHNLQLGMQSPLYDLLIKDIWAEFKKDRKERTALYCDEAHRMLNINIIQTLEFIVHAFKQFRKYGSFIEIMTQQVGDIISMGIQYAQQILANATFKKFLYMDTEWEQLVKIQKLSERELRVVQRKTKKGKGIIIAGETRAMFQSEATLDQLEFIDPETYAKVRVG
ncbi:VirB4 family type IV secretion system protein [Paenibacillus alvei]|uniref:VirB4 family type IV secretion system protein n=1 Tax=Paenibacillus alvei TaxID=44250 RepID=UPI00227E9D5F|nr:hypothetical protein [Paenibacillus alvei]